MNPKFSRYYTFIKPITNNPKVKNYSSIAFTLFTMAILGYFAVRPTVSTIIGLQKSIKEQETILDTLKVKSDHLVEGKRNLQKIDPATQTKLSNILPERTDPGFLIKALNDLAKTADASISGLQFEPVALVGSPPEDTTNLDLQEVVFTFNVTGTYPKFEAIIAKMAEFKRLLTINSILISRSNNDYLVMSVNAQAYFYKAGSGIIDKPQ